MLRTTPTRIELKQEDIREYEDMKEMWKKESQMNNDQRKDHIGDSIYQETAKNAQKNERHSRMGYNTQRK